MIGFDLKEVTKTFPAPGGEHIRALDGLTLCIHPSEIVVVVGANGSGKSTLLNLLAGVAGQVVGSVSAFGDGRHYDWLRLSHRKRTRLSALIQQDPAAGSVGDLTVLENVCLAGYEGTSSLLRRSTSRARRTWLLNTSGTSLPPAKIDARANELSQGQRQLLALDMVFVRSPRAVLLDEFTASLDQNNARRCLDRLMTYHSAAGCTIVMVTHDLVSALRLQMRIIVLNDGKVLHDIERSRVQTLSIEDLVRLSSSENVSPPLNVDGGT